MAKIKVYGVNGEKAKEITTDLFDASLRTDIVQKIAEIERLEEQQPYAPYLWAGMQTSASGNVKHNRHVWKTDRGRGMSRFPKKRMSDKGSHFVWVGAVSPETKGGRRAHPPKVLRADLKINKKERIMALKTALALIASAEEIQKKYTRLESPVKIELPVILDSKTLGLKTKEFFSLMQKILGDEILEIAIQDKKVRAGIGKMRNRRYKKTSGMLLITGNKEDKKISGIEVIKAKDLKVKDIFANGPRLSFITEEAIKDLELRFEKK